MRSKTQESELLNKTGLNHDWRREVSENPFQIRRLLRIFFLLLRMLGLAVPLLPPSLGFLQ